MSDSPITLVGAGLAGSLLAIYLARRGYKVTVYERRPDMRHARISEGRSINLALANRGIRALRKVGLYKDVASLLIPMRGRMLHEVDGATCFQPYGKDPSEMIFSISRGGLNKLLMDTAEKQHGVDFRFAHRCESIDLQTGALVLKNESDGSVHVDFKVDGATINPKTIGDKRLSRIEQALSSARKITGSYTLGPRGHMTALKMNIPKDATRTGQDMADNLRWALVQMTPAFPEEPVGQGAKWTVHEGVQQGGIHVNQLSTMEVVKIEGSRVELAVQAQQSAAPQPFSNPGIAIINQLKLLGAEANGSLDWDLTQLAPRAADLSSNVLKSVDQPTSDPENPTVEVIVKASRALKYGAR